VDPHIFADPDPGSQNLADPTDPDPEHWYYHFKIVLQPAYNNAKLHIK